MISQKSVSNPFSSHPCRLNCSSLREAYCYAHTNSNKTPSRLQGLGMGKGQRQGTPNQKGAIKFLKISPTQPIL